MLRFIPKPLRFLFITLISLILTLNLISPVWGQLPLLTPPAQNQVSETPRWDLNKAYPCGRFWCSQIYTYNGTQLSPTEIYTPEYILAAQQEPDQSVIDVINEVESRAKLIKRTFWDTFKRIVDWKTISAVSVENDWRFWLPTTVKPLHPWTPDVEVGIQNNQTVIFLPPQPELGLGQTIVITVTDADAQANAMTIEQLGQTWRDQIRLSYSNMLWGYELDRQHPWWRVKMAIAFLLTALMLIWLLHLIREWFSKQVHRTRRELNTLINSLSVDPEAIAASKLNNQAKIAQEEQNQDSLETEETDPPASDNPPSPPRRKSFKILKTLSRRPEKVLSTIFLEKQAWLRQQRNFFQLCLRLISIAQLLVLIVSLGMVALTFRSSRFLYLFFFQELIVIPFVWVALVILDKLCDFAIDYSLNRWATEAQAVNPNSNRYTLRVTTYSTTLKRASTLFFTVIGIYATIWIMGIDPAVLAGAGVAAVAIAFLSRNFLEDVLNGVLILCTDRYAIGDVVDVGGGLSGLVEDMNLYVTSLRNLDGQVIVIPNGKISSVINMSKDWSRVNFTIKIAWDADLKKTIQIMQQIDKELQNEPQWREKILEPLEILGIDEISHEGILIHALMKTQPKEQWSVDREFRIRLKYALDAAGISLGVPQQQIWHRNVDGALSRN